MGRMPRFADFNTKNQIKPLPGTAICGNPIQHFYKIADELFRPAAFMCVYLV